jgi:hypothetical protein
MKFLEQYASKMKSMNGTTDSNGMPSQGDQELNQRTTQNMLTAHHINPEAGDGIGLDGFKEPPLEALIQMVKEGKIEKSVLGEDADLLLQESTNKDEAKRRADFEATGSLEIPVEPYDAGKEFLNNFRTPPG